MSSQPPEEPQFLSEHHLLSPASPKPIHFPTPANIPVLDMQTDVGFNQMESHTATRNTEMRPDMWKDPAEEQAKLVEETSPFSTGADAPEGGESHSAAAESVGAVGEIAQTNDVQPALASPSKSTSLEADQPAELPSTSTPLPATDANHPPADATVAIPNDAFQAQTDEVKLEPTDTQPDLGPVDFQALLNNLQPAPNGPALTANAPDDVTADSSSLPTSNLGAPPGSGLPPRPPPQEQPLINSNYVHSQHIRDYHPHAAHSAYVHHSRTDSQGNAANPDRGNFVPPVSPGTSQSAMAASESGKYSPHVAVAAASTGNGATAGFAADQVRAPGEWMAPVQGAGQHAGRRPEDRPWNAAVQAKYDYFLEEERRHVAEGRWEQFPPGSRLFVGNLSSESVTKRDIFHVFHTYGDLAQISIKQAYGFVQFLREDACMQALHAEQGTQIREKTINLEVSKPQKSRPQAQNQRRSRSPSDHRGRPGANIDRYAGGRAGDNGMGGGRDDYRSDRRSPSPRGYRDRYDERYDDRYRGRSRSPEYGGRGGGRQRSPPRSPRRDESDDLPLPRRHQGDVPDVQIIVLGEVDREFVAWVRQAFASRSIRVDVLLLSPRLSEQAVIRRQIVEGVLGVVRLRRENMMTAKIPLQLFDRSAGARNVKFEEYDLLPPPTCAELILRAKGTVSYAQPQGQQQHQVHQYQPEQPRVYIDYAQPQPQHGYPHPAPQQAYPPTQPLVPRPAGPAPDLRNVITNFDPNGLQHLLAQMNQTPQSANAYGGAAAPPNQAVQALQHNPQMAGYAQQQQQGQGNVVVHRAPAAPPVDMELILARLGGGGTRRFP